MEIALYNVKGQAVSKVTVADEILGVEPNDHAIYLDVKQYLANQRQGTHKAKERGEVAGSTKKPWKQKGRGGARAGHKRSPLWRHGGRVFGPRPRDYRFKLNHKLKVLARKSALVYKIRENKLTLVETFTYNQIGNDNTPKTKTFLNFLAGFNAQKEKVLFVLPALPLLPKMPDTRKKRGLYVEGYIPKNIKASTLTYKQRQEKIAAEVTAYSAKKATFDEQAQKNKMLYLAARNLPNVSIITANELTTYNVVNAHQVIMLQTAFNTIVEHLTA